MSIFDTKNGKRTTRVIYWASLLAIAIIFAIFSFAYSRLADSELFTGIMVGLALVLFGGMKGVVLTTKKSPIVAVFIFIVIGSAAAKGILWFF